MRKLGFAIGGIALLLCSLSPANARAADDDRPRVLVASLGPESIVPRLESELHVAGFATREHIVPPSSGLTASELVAAMRAHRVTSALLVRGSQVELWSLKSDGTLVFEESIPTREPQESKPNELPFPRTEADNEVSERVASIRAVERLRTKVVTPTFKAEPQASMPLVGSSPHVDLGSSKPKNLSAVRLYLESRLLNVLPAGDGPTDTILGGRIAGGARFSDHWAVEMSGDVFDWKTRGDRNRYQATQARFNLGIRYVLFRSVVEPYLFGEAGFHYAAIRRVATAIPDSERPVTGTDYTPSASSSSLIITFNDSLFSGHVAALTGVTVHVSERVYLDSSFGVDVLTAKNFGVRYDAGRKYQTNENVFPTHTLIASFGLGVKL